MLQTSPVMRYSQQSTFKRRKEAWIILKSTQLSLSLVTQLPAHAAAMWGLYVLAKGAVNWFWGVSPESGAEQLPWLNDGLSI